MGTLQLAMDHAFDRLGGAARYLKPAVVVAWAACLVGWGAVLALPNEYEAGTRVFVDTRTALSPVLRGLAIEDDASAYLNFARESLVGEARLNAVVEKARLVPRNATALERARAVSHLRETVDIEVSGDRAQPTGVVYTIRYRDRTPGRSLAVVTLLLDGFVEGTLGGKRESSATAEAFLSTQIAESERRLRTAEQRLADFKQRNVGLMPGTEGNYFVRLQDESDALRKAQAALSFATARRDDIVRQQRGETPFTAARTAAAGGGVTTADTPTMLAEARRKLNALLVRYTENHPGVITLRQEIAELERQRQREVAALRDGAPEAVLASGAGANPVYQSIQLAMNEADIKVAELRSEIGQRERRIGELRDLMRSMPAVEAEFAQLNRDYESTRGQHAALVDRLRKAQLGQDAEARSSVRFEVIDPPAAGVEPVAPNRAKLVLAVFLAALLLAAALPYLLNRLRPVLCSARDITDATGLPLLGEISVIGLDSQLAAARRGRRLVAGAAIALVLALAGVLGVVTGPALA
ncbi:MAG: XrtA system polysaccharide chain length determinant [Pseudomonadota bacterium]